MPTITSEAAYEESLTSSLIFNVVFSLIVIIVFPFLKRLFPNIFAPQSHLPRKNTGFFGYIVWFVDVFQQPLSVYATRGNLATMFAVFNMVLLGLYGFFTLISLTVLIPVYSQGTDQAWNTNYLTVWSRITIPHIERNSIMTLIPIFVIILFTVAVMVCYHQFTLIFVFFRQRCMRR